MLYRVEYWKPQKMVGLTMDEIPSSPTMTEYKIDANDEFCAAVLAHAYASGYTGKETDPIPFESKDYPARTIRERLEDDIKKYTGIHPEKRQDGGVVFMYQNFVGCWIIVYPV